MSPSTASRFTELLGAPPRVSAEWDPFSLHIVDETPLYAQASFGEYAIGVYLSGRHSIRRKIGNSVVEGWSDPGTINFTPPGIDGIWEASAPSRAVVVLIRPEFLSRAIEEHWDADPKRLEIVKQFLVRDPVIEAITLNLAREAANGSQSGRLYAQSACEFLAHHLIFRYSTLSRPPPRSIGGLSSRSLKLVLSYIEDSLGQRIELRELAAVAGISARHFERAFRQSTGYPPHAYVLERRLDVARQLLIDQPDLAIEQIALRLGFSSGSHFSSAFRQRTGCSPTEYRNIRSSSAASGEADIRQSGRKPQYVRLPLSKTDIGQIRLACPLSCQQPTSGRSFRVGVTHIGWSPLLIGASADRHFNRDMAWQIETRRRLPR